MTALVDSVKERLSSVVSSHHHHHQSRDDGGRAGDGNLRSLNHKHKHKPAHHDHFGKFKNPWDSAEEKILPDEFPAEREKDIHPSVKRIKVVKPDFETEPQQNQLKAVPLGHAGVLVQMPPLGRGRRALTLLIDPIFADRASPTDHAGPSRRLEPPCEIEHLPQIDLLFISHNHYDHMDGDTLKQIIDRRCPTTLYVVPLGVGEWFVDAGVPESQVVELDWWEEKVYGPSRFSIGEHQPNGGDSDTASIRVACVPAQHNSARTGIDKAATLWAGFAIVQTSSDNFAPSPRRAAVYFAGDTGYRSSPDGPTCPAFKQIGEKYGPFNFSAIPIWRGGTLSFIAQWGIRLNPKALTMATHATPEDAVCIHKEVRSKASLGIHFGTFAGSEDEATYPVALLEEACRDMGVPLELKEKGGFGVADVGETLIIECGSEV